ncbi:MAG: hypothetical protein HFE63_04360 [Clostridiales bacterium]|nr:hypothetical protein [Clostridiales bacterium]
MFDILLKVCYTTLDIFYKEKFENAVRTTKLVGRHELSVKMIILLDDIVTTGVSILASAELLSNAGASCIIAASIALTDHKL